MTGCCCIEGQSRDDGLSWRNEVRLNEPPSDANEESEKIPFSNVRSFLQKLQAHPTEACMMCLGQMD
jgi:hypothetical protein